MADAPQPCFGSVDGRVTDIVRWPDVQPFPTFAAVLITCLDSNREPATPTHGDFLAKRGVPARVIGDALLLRPEDFAHAIDAGDVFVRFDACWFLATDDLLVPPYAEGATSDGWCFEEELPPGLAGWMLSARCVLLLADGDYVNYATFDAGFAGRLRGSF